MKAKNAHTILLVQSSPASGMANYAPTFRPVTTSRP